MTDRQCGSCMMCCKLMAIPALGKADGQMCRHACAGKGCTVYEKRPQLCQDFVCGWMLGMFPDQPEMRPDKSKVIFSATEANAMVFVDERFPEAWREPRILNEISRIADKGVPVVVSVGPGLRKRLFTKVGSIVTHRWITMSEPDENGVQWFNEG